MNCGVGRRRVSDLVLLWLWHRLAAVALIHPLAWEPPYAAGTALGKKKKKKNLPTPPAIPWWPKAFSWEPHATWGCRKSMYRELGCLWDLYVERSPEQTGGAGASQKVWQLCSPWTWRPLKWVSQKKRRGIPEELVPFNSAFWATIMLKVSGQIPRFDEYNELLTPPHKHWNLSFQARVEELYRML